MARVSVWKTLESGMLPNLVFLRGTQQQGYDSDSSADYFWDANAGESSINGYTGYANVHTRMSRTGEQAPLLRGQHSSASSHTSSRVTRTRNPDSICSITSLPENDFPDDVEYTQVIRHVELAIDYGVYPEMIKQGSSGSYFAKNTNSVGSFHFLT